MITDSGERTEFESGAVRDMQKGKGRCDLMPLDVIASLANDGIIHSIAAFQQNGDALNLKSAIKIFMESRK